VGFLDACQKISLDIRKLDDGPLFDDEQVHDGARQPAKMVSIPNFWRKCRLACAGLASRRQLRALRAEDIGA
jgi:hypothetical protein